MSSDNWFAKSRGDFLFVFDKTIATFVEISQSNFSGGISTFIPFKDSGISIKLTHAAVAAGNEEVRDGFQDSITASLIQPWPYVKYSGWLPSSLILEIAKV